MGGHAPDALDRRRSVRRRAFLMLPFLVLLLPPVTLVTLVWIKDIKQRRHPLHPERRRTRSKPVNLSVMVRRVS